MSLNITKNVHYQGLHTHSGFRNELDLFTLTCRFNGKSIYHSIFTNLPGGQPCHQDFVHRVFMVETVDRTMLSQRRITVCQKPFKGLRAGGRRVSAGNGSLFSTTMTRGTQRRQRWSGPGFRTSLWWSFSGSAKDGTSEVRPEDSSHPIWRNLTGSEPVPAAEGGYYGEPE